MSALPVELPDTIGFARLHALAARGYRASLGLNKAQDGFVCVDLHHPRTRGKNPPPPITLWSDGIISTSRLLWPEQHVPSAEGIVPDWQRVIEQSDHDRFLRFASEVPKPTLIDLYVNPALREAKIFAVRLIFGATLSVTIAMAIKIALHA